MKSIIVSSAKPGTGKTTISCFVAMNLATRGNKILFLDSSDNLNGYLFFTAVDSIKMYSSIKELFNKRNNGQSDAITNFQRANGLDVEFTNDIKNSLKLSKNQAYDYIIIDTNYSNGQICHLSKLGADEILLINDGTTLTEELTRKDKKFLDNKKIKNIIVLNNTSGNNSYPTSTLDSIVVNYRPNYDQYYDEITYTIISTFDILSNNIM